MNGDENGFLNELRKVKSEKRYEMKPFMSALFFKSKNDMQNAELCYQAFKNCEHSNENMGVVMDDLFSNEETATTDAFTSAVNSFRNPAIIQLIDIIIDNTKNGSVS